jgi:L-alanine-DL-glutamate epimerase-like enolase superfamily enzyme
VKIADVRVVSWDFGPARERFWDSTVANPPRRGFALVEVETDEGLVGQCPAGANRAIVEQALRPLLVGEDPLLIERCWRKMFESRHTTVGGDFWFALGRVDVALWDLAGKILGQPLWKLLGGHRRRVEVYSGGGFYAEGKDVAGLVAETERYLAMGYRAVKMKVGWRGTTPKHDAERVRAVRETIGPDAKLMVDGNHAWRADEAIRFGRLIERYEPFWIEEPVPHTDLRGGAEVCAALDTPVATGEMETSRWGFRQMLEARALDVCQADPVNCGGLTEWRKIAALASAHHVPLAPHGTEFIGQHCVGALPEALIVESYPGPYSLSEYLGGLEIRDGFLELPDRPGLGLTVDRAALDRLAATA